MSAFVFFYSASAFFAGLVCLTIGLLVLWRNRSLGNILYFVVTLGLFWAGVSEAFLRVAPDAGAAFFWLVSSRVSWLTVYASFLYFTYILSNIGIRYLSLIYLPPLVLYLLMTHVFPGQFIAGFRRDYFGYTYIPGPWAPLYTLFFFLYVGLGLLQLYLLFKKGKAFYRRKQAELILWAALVPLVIGSISDEILPILGILSLPVAIQTVAVMIGVAGYALLRYSPVEKISEGMIAESVADALFDGLFLTDDKKIINYVNPAGCRLSHYRTDELLGKPIEMLLESLQEKLTRLIRKDKTRIEIEMTSFPLAGNKGFIYLTRDLSGVIRSRNAIRKMSEEEKNLIERERKIIAYLSRFSELTEEKAAQLWWGEIEQEGSEIAGILKPVYDLGLQYLRTVDEVRIARDELAKKVEEIDRLNQFMSGRDEVLKQLEREYQSLAGKQ